MAMQELLVEAVGSQRGVGAADRLCGACVGLLNVDAVAIGLIFDGASTGTFGVSGPPARVYDEVQFTVGEGPCFDSVSKSAPVAVPDLAAEVRWSAYPAALMAHGIRSVYALPIVVAGEAVGVLNLFRSRPGPLAGDEMAGALLAAELAEMPLLDLLGQDLLGRGGDPGSDLWTELTALTRTEVNQATGMLVAQLDIGAAEALVRLRAHAYATNTSATDVARAILDRRIRLEIDQ